MLKAYKYHIYPNKEQPIFFAKTFGCARFVYNKMLADRINFYAQYKAEFSFLTEIDSLALANLQMNLNQAYAHFFRDKTVGFPTFKSKKDHHQSYTTNNQKGTVCLVNYLG
jgi:putative transposase